MNFHIVSFQNGQNRFLSIDKDVAKEEWTVEAIKRCYEAYARNNLYEDLEELSGKNLGG